MIPYIHSVQYSQDDATRIREEKERLAMEIL